jgi:cell division protein FtsI (penicillin-binding protein 3)
MRLLRDVRERPIESELVRPVRPGTSITVTLDAGIQFVAERELRAAALAAHADSGSVVVMIPSSGEVLAFASFPSFDPNETPKPGESPHIRFNHAFSVPFEPGSVFKIVTLAAALDGARLRPDDRVFCHNGRLSLFGRVIHEAKKGFGWLSVAEVLEHSSNIGAIEIGRKIGDQRLLEYVRRMGFGKRTGLPLPAESPGTVRNLPKWTATSVASVAMGHEISATTLQLARACGVIASGGLLEKPRLVLRRREMEGRWVTEPGEPPQRILNPEAAIALRQIMEGVVLRGTGKQARLEGYSSGGKTGTAQIWDPVARRYTNRYNSSFVGFAPVTNPAVVVGVTLNGVREYGGVVASPVFRKVATEALLLLDVPKDLPEPAPPPSREPLLADDLALAELSAPPEDLPATPSRVVAAAVPPLPTPPSAPPSQEQTLLAANGLRAPNFTGKSLRAVLEESLARGVPVEIVGAGIARAQTPAAGSPLEAGQSVRVEFR